MTRLNQRLDALRAAGRKGLVPFITAGDPALAATVPAMHALVQAGADVIELGVPFSDPMADGPVIQRSSERALARGAGLRYVLDCVRDFRARDATTPVVLMGYLNPIEIHGMDTFAADAAEAGVDGVLLVDLPPEEAGAYRRALSERGVALISLAAPTTPAERMARLCEQAQGYLYYVSYAGVTGAAQLDAADVGQHLREVQSQARVPVFAGFGIRDADSAAAVALHADGVVVGSALVSAMNAADPATAAVQAGNFLRPLRAALDGVGR
ncbi:tryptophan synthase subunit alpha [Thermomonas sp.]|uniref:tryptophan synthase subunit alpha n=1 Tax=Thermomonas sp. TaxID=1971895 RepID=UPI002615208E|nr:tryptophan synthase subunit alpha [Thermomonas sp.]MCO5054802.1 tryptophan synthase subunit alpha [Thermomonas sp.]